MLNGLTSVNDVVADAQSITYGGRLAALVTPRGYFLVDRLLRAERSDPERRFVMFMCLYARDVAAGVLPGPYRERDARRYARVALDAVRHHERPCAAAGRRRAGSPAAGLPARRPTS